MHRRDHVGMAMLAYAPVGFLLLRERQLGLAVVGLFAVLAVEPFPDNDFWIPGLSHRGTSHSLLSALVVGGVIGALGWFAGDRVTVMLANVLAGLDTSMVGIFAGLAQWAAEQLRLLDGRTLAVFGFAVGVYGVIVHLLADVITVSGIRPLLPLSRRRVSLSPIHADSPVANNVLFGLGVLALVAVFAVTAPGVGFVGPSAGFNIPPACPMQAVEDQPNGCIPDFNADFSLVGVASGQTTNQSANHSPATVELDSTNNTTAKTLVVSKATLPEGGFVAVHGVGYSEGGDLENSVLAVSKHLDAGTHRNITIPVKRGVPGNDANSSRLNITRANLTAVPYRDTNHNHHYDFVASLGQNDTPYQKNGSPVVDTESVAFEGNVKQANQRSQTSSARIRFSDQQVRRGNEASALTVESATLPNGGFVVVHDQRYLPPTRDPLDSAIGVSRYLTPGTHHNVTIRLLNGSVTKTQTLVAVPYHDTNHNQQYDYITGNGGSDYAYITRRDGSTAIVNQTATVRVPGSRPSTAPTSISDSTPTSTPMPTSTPTATVTGSSTVTGETGGESGGIFGIPTLWLGGGVVVVLLVLTLGQLENRRR